MKLMRLIEQASSSTVRDRGRLKVRAGRQAAGPGQAKEAVRAVTRVGTDDFAGHTTPAHRWSSSTCWLWMGRTW